MEGSGESKLVFKLHQIHLSLLKATYIANRIIPQLSGTLAMTRIRLSLGGR